MICYFQMYYLFSITFIITFLCKAFITLNFKLNSTSKLQILLNTLKQGMILILILDLYQVHNQKKLRHLV